MPPDPSSQANEFGGEHDHLKQLGKYQIQKKLGAGGMGTVFLAIDTELKRTVALKVLAKERAENPILVKRFKSEAQSAAQLTHPNIVHVYEAGEADGFLYIALEYVDGIDTLELLRKRGIVPVKRSIDIIKQTCKALQHAFEKGIVHRDIKPSNLMIRQDGTIKLADMGLARSVDDTIDTNITRAGTTVGTVDYMSPEQARDSRAADIRSDIYSLGCTWYHLLTGSIPYPEGSLTNKLQAHASGRIPDPRGRNPNVPEGVVAVMRRMMAKKKEERVPDARRVDRRSRECRDRSDDSVRRRACRTRGRSSAANRSDSSRHRLHRNREFDLRDGIASGECIQRCGRPAGKIENQEGGQTFAGSQTDADPRTEGIHAH